MGIEEEGTVSNKWPFEGKTFVLAIVFFIAITLISFNVAQLYNQTHLETRITNVSWVNDTQYNSNSNTTSIALNFTIKGEVWNPSAYGLRLEDQNYCDDHPTMGPIVVAHLQGMTGLSKSTKSCGTENTYIEQTFRFDPGTTHIDVEADIVLTLIGNIQNLDGNLTIGLNDVHAQYKSYKAIIFFNGGTTEIVYQQVPDRWGSRDVSLFRTSIALLLISIISWRVASFMMRWLRKR